MVRAKFWIRERGRRRRQRSDCRDVSGLHSDSLRVLSEFSERALHVHHSEGVSFGWKIGIPRIL